MIKALIFDLDGTLLNTIEDIADSCNMALEALGYPTHETEEYKYFIGDGIMKLMEKILPEEKSLDIEEQEKMRVLQDDFYIKKCNKTRPFDGILELLQELKQKGYKLAVISNKPDDQTQKIVATYFNPEIFDIITGNKPGYPTKPDTKLTNEIISQLGQKPENCAFIGDSDVDMMTAVNAKLLPIGVAWGFRTRDELLTNGAKHIVSYPLEIVEIVKNA